MSKPVWWTCGCGQNQCSSKRGAEVVCGKCGKVTRLAQDALVGQGGFDFQGGK